VEGIPRHLPALHKAQRIQSRAARVGFDWTRTEDVLAKVEEEVAETREAIREGTPSAVREEIGDLLFAVVNLCRFAGVDAEEALDRSNAKFMQRFRLVEERVRAGGRELKECALEELDAIWNQIKAEEGAR
jgi:tetrapyrrole methylase family protein/MazG family protein